MIYTPAYRRCPECGGTGECAKCFGTGQNVALNSDQADCPHCKGTGHCPTCKAPEPIKLDILGLD